MDDQDEQFNKLLDFVLQSLEQGYSEEEIRTTLEDRDLNPEYIDELFAYAELSDATTVTLPPEQTTSPPSKQLTPAAPIPTQTEPTPQPSIISPSQTGVFSGRIGRVAYLLGGVYANIIMFSPTLLIISVQFLLPGFQLKSIGTIGLIAILVVYLVLFIFTTLINISLIIRRLHDIGKSGKLALIALLPVLASFLSVYLILTRQYQELQLATLISLTGTAFGIYLQFMPGAKDANKYGNPIHSYNFWFLLGFKRPKQ